MKEDIGGGSISEWNEGNFKNLRLHEAQEMINYGKNKPFDWDYESSCWKYDHWKAGIDILYGEGESKYSDEEIKEVEKIIKVIEKSIKLKKPYNKIKSYGAGGVETKYTPIIENQDKIIELLRIYEKIVKKFNDMHGLSTRNKEEEDWRGL